MPSLGDLCRKVRDRLRPDVRQLKDYTWFGSLEPRFYDVIKRSIVVRQWEACEAIQSLIENGHGAMGCTLLRPSYEELLWILYFEKNKEVAPRLALCLARKEVSDSHKAQKSYLGENGIKSIGFRQKKIRSLDSMRKPTYRELQEIGAKLGWKDGQTTPSVAFIAKQVGREREYNYLYQGTSRSVHFSAHELQRRVWGEHGKVKIGSNTFERYWADFSAYWSTKILLETMVATGFTDRLSHLSENDMKEFLKDLHKLRAVQILTATELVSWQVPSSEKKNALGAKL